MKNLEKIPKEGNVKIKWLCDCGEEFLATKRSYKSGCKNCKSKKMKLAKTKNLDYYIKKIPESFIFMKQISEDITENTEVIIKCKKCNSIIDTTFKKIRKTKNLCSKCKLNKEKEDFINRISSNVKLVGEYKNTI